MAISLSKILNNSLKGIVPNEEEIKLLLDIEDEGSLNELTFISGKIKELIYGKRIVLFTPLYLSNECLNNCLYCAFRRDNKEIQRKTLSTDEIILQAQTLEKTGFKRVLLVAAEHPKKCSLDYLINAVRTIYENTGLHIVHLNAAPYSEEEFIKLKSSGIGVFQLFQETYHRETYKIMHPGGKKNDFDWRRLAMDRAISAGIKDVGIGALLGLFDYKYEILELIRHSRELEAKFGFGPHTISVPRLRPAHGSALLTPPYPVSDFDFRKIVAILRLAVPYTGIVVTTREHSLLRDEIISAGASQISAGSHTEPGGYSEKGSSLTSEDGQFSTADKRTLEEIIKIIIEKKLVPSLCTSCYRAGRTGENFVNKAKNGEIQGYCLPNALLTLEEYALDFAPAGTKQIIDKMINDNMKNIPDKLFNQFNLKLKRIKNGERDLYF
ncbi:MAG: [FeFe] hydrogenase H-cluster radical SAM maturase HydG [bacterium]|nr:[FeFe] hydrogenase H-cluster radical SAM maturase HydG [bacterium]